MKTDTASALTIYSGPAFKTVDWCYPSSPNAVRFKKPDGCWSVSLTFYGKKGTQTVAKTETQAGGFDSREAAQKWADEVLPEVRQLIARQYLGSNPLFRQSTKTKRADQLDKTITK